jgi:tetratricopeptide (TPR) repeat protein
MQRRYEEAIPHLKRALTLNPKFYSSEIVLALCYFSMNQFERAVPLLEKAYHRSAKDPVVLRHLGLAYSKLGRPDEALRVFTRWVEVEPGNPDALYYKGRAGFQLSLSTFEMLKEVAPDSARYHELQAEILRQQGRTEPAVAEYKKAISAAPGTAELYYALGSLYWEKGRLDEARAQFEQALQLNPDDPATNYLMGDALLQEQDVDGAEKYLVRALHFEPDYVDARLDMAKLYKLKGDDQNALQLFKEVARLAPDRYEPHYALYELYRKAGDEKRARTELQVFETLKQKKDAESAHPESVLPTR